MTGMRRIETMERLTLPLLPAVAAAAMWFAAGRVFGIPDFIVPPPASVVQELLRRPGLYGEHLWVTALEATAGFGIGTTMAIVVALLAEAPRMRLMLVPTVAALQAFPKETLAPLYGLLFGLGMASKIAFAASIAFFPVCVNLIRGLRRVDPEYVQMFQTWGASRLHILLHCRLNFALPFLVSGLRLGASLSIVGAVVAEFAGSNAGIGFLMKMAAGLVNARQLYAAIVVLTLLGIAMYGSVALLDRMLASARRGLES